MLQTTKNGFGMKNLGEKTWQMLQAAGIADEAALRKLGAVPAYLAVCRQKNSSLNLLWALEGALTDRHWQDIAKNERTRLLIALDDLRRKT